MIVYCTEMWQLAAGGHVQGIWFWVGLYTLIVCSYSVIFQLRTRCWPSVEGQLAELGVEKFGATDLIKSDQDYISNALYTFNVSGVDYDGTRISPWIFVASHNAKFVLEKQMSSIQRLPNGKVKVFYNPKKPQKSYLIIAGKVGLCITLLIAVLPLILFYNKYYM